MSARPSLYVEQLLERAARHRLLRDHAMLGARMRRHEGDRKSALILVTLARAHSRRALQVLRQAAECGEIEVWANPSAVRILAGRSRRHR